MEHHLRPRALKLCHSADVIEVRVSEQHPLYLCPFRLRRGEDLVRVRAGVYDKGALPVDGEIGVGLECRGVESDRLHNFVMRTLSARFVHFKSVLCDLSAAPLKLRGCS